MQVPTVDSNSLDCLIREEKSTPTVLNPPEEDTGLISNVLLHFTYFSSRVQSDSFAKDSLRYDKPNLTDLILLKETCSTNTALLETATKTLINSIATLTSKPHGNGPLDKVCFELLTLMVTTSTGFEYFNHHRHFISRWVEAARCYKLFSKAFGPFHAAFIQTEKDHPSQKVEMKRGSMSCEIRSSQVDSDSVPIFVLLAECGDRGTTTAPLRRRVKQLLLLSRDMPREEFCRLFPKSCCDCISLSLICAGELLDDSQLICNIVKVLLNDAIGEILTKEEVDCFRKLTRSYYHRDDKAYPFMGCCLDFGKRGGNKDNVLLKAMAKLGHLIESDLFSKKMLTQRPKCIQFVKDFFTDTTSLSVEEFCKS